MGMMSVPFNPKMRKDAPAGYWLLVGDVEIIINLPQKFSTFPSITVWG